MGSRVEAPKSTQLYSKLSAEQQQEFGKVVIDKLRTLIGGHGELSVLAEYIAVMLQSNRPQEQIQSELEAFLQDQSRPFTAWLMDQLAKFTGEDASAQAEASKGEALLLRAVRDARQGSAAAAAAPSAAEGGDTAGGGKRRERGEKERREKRSSHAASATTAPSERPSTSARHRSEHRRSRSRQRSRPRRRHRGGAASGGVASSGGRRAEASREALRDVPNGGSAGSREAAERKAVLTPNVQFLRDAYHQKALADDPRAAAAADGPAPGHALTPPPDTRWHFRAEPTMPLQAYEHMPPHAVALTPAPAPHHLALGPPPLLHHPHHAAAYGPPPLGQGPPGPLGGQPPAAVPAPREAPSQALPPQSSRPRHFQPKKWRVARANTVVRATEQLDSAEVRILQEGEIVEQVAPCFKMKSGIVRIQIRHPSSPQFPEPIGWVTQDATAAGGPKFLEPGPEPMAKGWRPPAWGGSSPATAWRPRGPAGPSGGPLAAGAGRPAAPMAPRGPYGFQNLTWKPSNAGSAEGASADATAS